MFSSLKEAQDFFINDRFAMINGMEIIELGDDQVTCRMEVNENHMNAAGAVMGGVYYSLADFTFAVLVNHIHKISVTLDSNITYHVPAKGTTLFATAKVIRTGKTTTFCETIITDAFDRRLATVTGTAYKI